MWTVEDLRKMADSESRLYQTAIAKGLPDGFTRQFRKDMSIFKPIYRTVGSLDLLRNDGEEGGFMRGG